MFRAPAKRRSGGRAGSRPLDGPPCRRRSGLRSFHYSSLNALLARVRHMLALGQPARAQTLLDRYEARQGRQDALSSLMRLLCVAALPDSRQLQLLVARVTLFVASDRALAPAARLQLLAALKRMRQQGEASIDAVAALRLLASELRPAA